MPYPITSTKYLLPIYSPIYSMPFDVSQSKEKRWIEITDTQLLGAFYGHNKGVDGVLAEGIFEDNLTKNTWFDRFLVFNQTNDNSLIGSSVPGDDPADFSFIQQLIDENNDDDSVAFIDQLTISGLGINPNYISNTGLCVFIKDRFGFASVQNPLTWDVTSVGQDTYLYVQITDEQTPTGNELTTLRQGALNTLTNTTGVIPPNSLLVAIRTSGLETNLNLSPSGKKIIQTVADHANTDNNPHGSLLFTKEIVASGLEALGFLKIPQITVPNLTGNTIQNELVPLTISSLVISGTLTTTVAPTLYNSTVSEDINVLNKTVLNTLLSSGVTLRGNSIVANSKTVDSLDFSSLGPLLDGTVVSGLHWHQDVGYRTTIISPVFPEFGYAALSNPGQASGASGTIFNGSDLKHNYVGFKSKNLLFDSGVVVVGIPVPTGFRAWRSIKVSAKAEQPPSFNLAESSLQLSNTVFFQSTAKKSKILFDLKDINGVPVSWTQSGTPATNPFWTQYTFSEIDGIWTPGSWGHLVAHMQVESGTRAYLGEMILDYLV